MIKPITITLIAFVGAFTGWTQQTVNSEKVEVDRGGQNPTDWVIYLDNEEFVIQYKFIQCDPRIGYDNESVLLKFKNKTSQTLNIAWNIDLYYDGVCKTCDFPDEYHNALQLNPMEEKEGNCDIYSDSKLKMFSKFVDQNYTKGLKLTSFKLSKLNLIIN